MPPLRRTRSMLTLTAALALSPLAAHAQSIPTTLTFQPAPTEPAANPPAAPSTAESTASAPPVIPSSVDPTWKVSIEPIVWYMAPSGDLKLPASGAATPSNKVDIADLDLDNPRLSPAGSFRIASGRWTFAFFGAAYDTDHTNTVNQSFQLGSLSFAPGDQAKTEMTLGFYEVTAGCRIFDYDWRANSTHPETAEQALFVLSLYGGVLMQDVDIMVQQLGTQFPDSTYSNLFVQPIIGLDFHFAFADQFAIDLRLSGGGLPLDDESSASVDIAVAFTWQATDHIGLQIGWRQIAYWLSDGDGQDEFEYNGAVAGLFAGVTLRF